MSNAALLPTMYPVPPSCSCQARHRPAEAQEATMPMVYAIAWGAYGGPMKDR
jgi:hypothetical protein